MRERVATTRIRADRKTKKKVVSIPVGNERRRSRKGRIEGVKREARDEKLTIHRIVSAYHNFSSTNYNLLFLNLSLKDCIVRRACSQ